MSYSRRRKSARFRGFLFYTGVPRSKLVTRLTIVPPSNTSITTRSILQPFISVPGLLAKGDDADEIRRFELANCFALLYFAIGYYLRVSRRNQLMYTLRTKTIGKSILDALTLMRTDRKESIEYFYDAMDAFRQYLTPLYADHGEHPRVFGLSEYLGAMGRQLKELTDIEYE